MLANMKRLLPLLLAFLLLVMAPSAAAQDILVDETAPTVDPSTPAEYSTMTATFGNLVVESLPCNAAPYYPLTKDVVCDYSGVLLQKFTVSKGDTVKAGDIVAYLYRPCSQTDIARQKLNLQRAEEDMKEGISQRQKAIAALQTQLKEEDDSYEKEILQLTIEYKKVELEQYRYQQKRSIDSLKNSIAAYDPIPVTAPQGGTVTNLSRVKTGEAVNEGSRLMSIEDTSVMLLRLKGANDSFVYNLPLTITATIKGADGGEPTVYTATGHVIAARNVIPKLMGSSDRGIYIQLDPGQTLPDAPNYSVSCVLRQLDNVLILPETALNQSKYYGTQYIEILKPDGSIEQRFIERGTTDSFFDYTKKAGQIWYYWITSGLSEGETVIVRN